MVCGGGMTGDGTSRRVSGSLEIGSFASRIGGGGPRDWPKDWLRKGFPTASELCERTLTGITYGWMMERKGIETSS